MARPVIKEDLIKFANEKYNELWNFINSMTEEEQTTLFSFDVSKGKEAHWKRDKNIRDVLIHIYEWHQLLLNWIDANKKGENKPFLPEPYNWKTYGEMNVEMIWKKHQNTPYGKAKDMLKDSHKKVMILIETFSNEELFTKKHFFWAGGSTLGQYCTSVTSSHYDWAIKKIKKHIQSLK